MMRFIRYYTCASASAPLRWRELAEVAILDPLLDSWFSTTICWHGHLSAACPRYPSVGYVDSTSALPTPYLSGFRGAIRSI